MVGSGTGSEIDAPMEVPGEDLPGVYKGTEFLIRANIPADKLPPGMQGLTEVGKKVVVVGGGDTASDCRSPLSWTRTRSRSSTSAGRRTVRLLPRRRERRDRPRSARADCVSQRAGSHALDFSGGHVDVPGARLSGDLVHGAVHPRRLAHESAWVAELPS